MSVPAVKSTAKPNAKYALALFMIATGTCNTLLSKYQDMQCVENCDDPARRRLFEQPVIQTVQMFAGEALLWLFVGGQSAYRLWESRSTHGHVLVPTEDSDDEAEEVDYANDTQIDEGTELDIDGQAPLKPAEWRHILCLGGAAALDCCATTLMNLGLFFVTASVYQMTRGSLSFFVELLSIFLLKQRSQAARWKSIFLIMVGVVLVGLAGIIFPNKVPIEIPDVNTIVSSLQRSDRVQVLETDAPKSPDAIRAVIGFLCIICAQLFAAAQIVGEDALRKTRRIEVAKVTAWEGVFGSIITLVIMVLGQHFIGNTAAGRGGYFDITHGLYHMFSNQIVLVTSVFIMISIAAFNASSIKLMSLTSSTARSGLDSCRTLFIWMVSCFLGWDQPHFIQFIGFMLLVLGAVLLLVHRPEKAPRRSPAGEAESDP